MLTGGREGGEQTTEGMRGSDTEDQVESLCGREIRGVGLLEIEPVRHAEIPRGMPSTRQRVIGDVDAHGPQLRIGDQSPQQPFTTTATEIEDVPFPASQPALQQLSYRLVTQRRSHRMTRMG